MLVACLALPLSNAGAQSDDDPDAERWDQSAFDLPQGKTKLQSDRDIVTVAGTFAYEKEFAVDTIESASVRVEQDPEADPPIPTECPMPDEIAIEGVERDQSAAVSVLTFSVQVVLPCNGPYIVIAHASATNAHEHEMRVSLGVSAPPGPVTELTSTPGANGVVDLQWEPPVPTPPDIVGYIIERAGPERTTAFADLSGTVTVREYADTTITRNGTYTYRVRAIRRAAVGTITGGPNNATTSTTEVTTAPTTTTTTTAPRFTQGTAAIPTVPPTRPTPSLPSPPTTGDPGFDDTIDYGERQPFDLPTTTLADPEFAGGSIVNEDEDSDTKRLLIPAAGASVLLVWAAHLFYVNRLAARLDLDEVPVVE